MNQNSALPKILIIDDDTSIRRSFIDYLEDQNYQTLSAADGSKGLELLKQENPDLVLTDLRMPEMDGLEFLRQLQEVAPGIPAIVISGANRIHDVVEALRLGAWDYMVKPIKELSMLSHAVNKALERARLIKENQEYQEHLEQMVEKRTTQLLDYQQHLEELVEMRTAVLKTANKDLEAFAYSISHDLQAPLRSIKEFTKILMEDYTDKLDDEGNKLGKIIRKNTVKMTALIDNLLAFSRMGQASLQFSRIDMRKMVTSIFNESTTAVERRRITFSVSDLPEANGDPNMIRQVWINLISNAVKYSAKQEQAEITVTYQLKDQCIYSLQDNGAGFDMKYVDKLFGVFKRLHSEKDFEGTGCGLALTQRIIERHGGQVWAQGRKDSGATFYFSLPNSVNPPT